jgi:hypothetical protein
MRQILCKVVTAGLAMTASTLVALAGPPDLTVDTTTDGFPQNPAIAPAPPNQCQKVPPGAIPAPSGTYVTQWYARETMLAQMDMFVVYGNEWFQGGVVLGPYGFNHVLQIARRMACVPWPLVIQPDLRPGYDAQRRAVIVQYLARAGVPNPGERVVLGFPRAEGLYGDEAPRIYYSMISGQGTTGAGYGGSGFGTGGLGGGAPSGGVGGSLGGAGLGMGGAGGSLGGYP